MDIFTIVETKLIGSFPTAEFEIKEYYSLSRLDVTNKSGGLLVYIKSSIPSRNLSCGDVYNSKQAISFEINLRKEKWLMISIYHPHLPDKVFIQCFLSKTVLSPHMRRDSVTIII